MWHKLHQCLSILLLSVVLLTTHHAQAAPLQQSNACITVYENTFGDPNGRGRSQQICGSSLYNYIVLNLSNYSLSGFDNGWNDQISSMDIPTGYKVRVWELPYQQAASEVFWSGSPWSQNLYDATSGPTACSNRWNDCISSLQICPPGSTACDSAPDQTYSAQYVDKNPKRLLIPGENVTLKLVLRNNSQMIWPAGIVKLATTRPDYNPTVDPTNDDYFEYPYVGFPSTRLVVLSEDIMPNGEVTFDIPITVPTPDPNYPARFVVRPIVEFGPGYGYWLAEYGYWDIETPATTEVPPYMPFPNSPKGGVTVPIGNVDFTWTDSGHPSPDGRNHSFRLKVATDSSLTNLLGEYSTEGAPGSQKTIPVLVDHVGQIYWQVGAARGTSDYAWSGVETFKVVDNTPSLNQPPNKPRIDIPTNGQQVTVGNTLDVSFTDNGDPDNAPNPQRDYTVLIAKDNLFQQIVGGVGHEYIVGGQPSAIYPYTSWSWPANVVAGTYYIKVRVFDGQDGVWSDIQSFTVQAATQTNQLLSPPVLLAPEQNYKTTLGKELLLRWSQYTVVGQNVDMRHSVLISKNDNSFASQNIVAGTGYYYCMAKGGTPQTCSQAEFRGGGYSWTPTDPGTYYWKVIAFDGQVTSDWTYPYKIFVRNPLVFIPGIMGSEISLFDTHPGRNDIPMGTIWPNILIGDIKVGGITLKEGQIIPCLKSQDSCYLTVNGIQTEYAVRISKIVRLLPGGYTDDSYSILTFLENNNYLQYTGMDGQVTKGCDSNQSNRSLFPFPYDWRLSNAQNAEKLATYINCINSFYPNAKVDIVAHSMGGLVARRFILDNPNKVDKLITIGSPWLGAPKMIYAATTGDLQQSLPFGIQQILIDKDNAKDLLQSIVGAHELLPPESYFAFYRGDNDRPLREEGDLDLDEDGNTKETFGYDGYVKAISKELGSSEMNNNESFHNYSNSLDYKGQDDWRRDSEFGINVKFYPIVGDKPDSQTIGQVILRKSCRLMPDQVCIGERDIVPQYTRGDGTVPLYSASRQWGSLDYTPPNTNIFWVNDHGDHAGMVTWIKVQQYTLCLLDGGDTNDCENLYSRQRSTRQQLLFTPFYHLKALGVTQILATDSNGKRTGTDGEILRYEINNADFLLTLSDTGYLLNLPISGTYTIMITTVNTPALIEVTKSDGIDNGNHMVEAVRYNDLNLPPNTLMQLILTPNGIQALQQDSDNDGMVDTIVPPTAMASGELAADTDSPLVELKLTELTNGQYQTVISATDVGQAGLKQVFYSTDGTHFNLYTGTFTLNPSTVMTVSAFADDYLGNRSGLFEQAVPRQNVNTTLRLVTPATVPLNTLFTVTVWLENTLASQDIQTVIVNLKPANLNMITAVCSQPGTDQPDNLIPYDSATYPACQPTSSGYIVSRWLTSSQVISGSGSWVDLGFKATQEGCTDILFDQHQLVNSQAKFVPHDVFSTTICALSNQQTLTGVVHLQSRPMGKLAGAQVTITNTQGIISKTVTDANGYYTFTNLALGDYTLRVRHPLFVGATRNLTLTGTPNFISTSSFAGDLDQSSNSNNCQKTVTLRDWYILAAGILPVNNPAFDINADGATDGRDMTILFNNIGTPNMCTTDAPDNYHRQAATPMPQLIASQAKLTWQPQTNGVMTLSISHVMTELIKSIGMRLEIPNGMTITTVTPHDKFASADSFLNLYQQGNVVYITLATPEDESLASDALILTMQTHGGDTQQIKMTDYNIVALAKEPNGNRIYLPIIAR